MTVGVVRIESGAVGNAATTVALAAVFNTKESVSRAKAGASLDSHGAEGLARVGESTAAEAIVEWLRSACDVGVTPDR